MNPTAYLRYLLFIAGMGGLLYGIDVGIIAGALPYLEATAASAWRLSAQQMSFIVAAVLLGSVLSSLFAGALADAVGRKWALVLAGGCFVVSIPMIAMASGYGALLGGRLLQGVSGGLIGVVVPLYLAECLDAQHRGRGTGLFQLMLTLGLVAAALVGWWQAREVEAVAAAGGDLAAAQDHAWRRIFWLCLLPGLVFTGGALLLSESPRWLLQRRRAGAARQALARITPAAQVQSEFDAMQRAAGTPANAGQAAPAGSLLRRRYVLPFALTCFILACNQATGINSILAYAVNILAQAGLPGSVGHVGDVAIKVLNAVMTVAAVLLVDRKGRKFLLMVGTGGIAASLAAAGLLFLAAERGQRDVTAEVQALAGGEALTLPTDAAGFVALGADPAAGPQQLVVAYAYGPFANVLSRRSDEAAAAPLQLGRTDTVQPDSVIGAFFRRLHLNPFPDPAAAATAPLRIESARVGPLPSQGHGWAVAACILAFVASFAVGPGVCVWLALSELMPTRIRSNGMSIALLVNQFVSTVIAGIFLPTVGRHGYAAMFFFWAGCTVLYFLAVAFLLPETRGKTLEEIEEHFA